MFSVARALAICTLLGGGLSPLSAMAQTWDGETDGDYLTATNWAGDVAPGPGDSAFLDDGGIANQPRLFVGDAATVNVVGVSAGRLTIEGNLSATSGVTISGFGSIVLLPTGSISGDVQNGAMLGIFGGVVTGKFTQTVGGTLWLDVGNLATIVGEANLAGTLAADLSRVVFDQPQLTFDLLWASSIAGDFASLNLTGLSERYSAATGIFKDTGGYVYRLTATAVPEPESVTLFVAALLLLLGSKWRQSRVVTGRPVA